MFSLDNSGSSSLGWLKRQGIAVLVGASLLCGAPGAMAQPVVPGFNMNTFPANDDGSLGPLNLGFSARFYGGTFTQVFLNNNGNFTFGGSTNQVNPKIDRDAWSQGVEVGNSSLVLR